MKSKEALELQMLILSAFLVFICLVGFIIYFVFLYKKRQQQNILEQEHLQSEFQQELLKTQVEVQEQTLTNISREIHDNITQVLSFVKLNLGLIDEANEKTKSKIIESRELIAQIINDLRNLSKSLSFEHIALLGMVKIMEIEISRLNNSGLIAAELGVEGEPYSLGEQRELVLFRIYQEALNNTLKHSGAKHLKINLQYSDELFNLTLEDDGVGFSPDGLAGNGGAGLKNMKNRAALIGAAASIGSIVGKGCCIKVSLNLIEQGLYNDTTPPDRFS